MASQKLLVITELFLPTKGGTAVWFDEVYRRIGGKEIHIVTANVPGATEHDATNPNTIHRVSLKRYWWLRPESLGMYTGLLWTCLKLIFTERFDAVHAGRVLPEGLVAWLVSCLIRKPLVVYAHGEEIKTWTQALKFQVMCFVYRRADRVIANSQFTQDELIKLKVKPERIQLISPGVDINRFCPGLATSDLKSKIGLHSDEKLILSVGRLSRRKGFDTIIKIIPKLTELGLKVRYVIVGIGDDWNYLAQLAKENKVTNQVHLLGSIDHDDLPRWYNACDLFAMPNREINGDTEGFGMVFLEAAACGKPVIAGSAGGTGAAVLDGVTGLRVDGTSEALVLAAILETCKNGKSETLGASGYARVRNGFSWEKVAERIANTLANYDE